MERLTRRMCGGWGVVPGYELNTARGAKAVVDRLAAYEDIGLMPDEIDSVFINSVMEENKRLKELAKAEKDGRLVALPVPVGTDKVAYGITNPDDGPQRIMPIECNYLEKLEIWDNPGHEVVIESDGWEIGESDIGKTVFLTREEAEAALKKREEKIN